MSPMDFYDSIEPLLLPADLRTSTKLGDGDAVLLIRRVGEERVNGQSRSTVGDQSGSRE